MVELGSSFLVRLYFSIRASLRKCLDIKKGEIEWSDVTAYSGSIIWI